MNRDQKIIIQSFGLALVETAIYAGNIAAIEAKNELQGPGRNQYDGNVPAQPNQADAPVGSSQLGTPVWDNLVIQAGSYVDSVLGVVNYPEIRIDTILFTLIQQHNVILTPIQGRDGEVIEYVSKMSFRINAKGGLFSTGNIRPTADIANLKKILNSNQPLIIGRCGFLDEWDISEMVVLNKNIPQMAGGYNYQLFEFDCIQNTPIILAQKQSA